MLGRISICTLLHLIYFSRQPEEAGLQFLSYLGSEETEMYREVYRPLSKVTELNAGC